MATIPTAAVDEITRTLETFANLDDGIRIDGDVQRTTAQDLIAIVVRHLQPTTPSEGVPSVDPRTLRRIGHLIDEARTTARFEARQDERDAMATAALHAAITTGVLVPAAPVLQPREDGVEGEDDVAEEPSLAHDMEQALATETSPETDREELFGLPDGWEVEDEFEGGQPNGVGVLEPSHNREWYTDARETHHRRRITLIGPWLEGNEKSAYTAQQETQ